MNLSALLVDLYGDLRYTSTPPAATIARLTRYLNRTQRELLSLPGLSRLRDDTLPIVTTANQAQCGLPQVVARLQAIVDRTNNYRLLQVPLSELRSSDPSQTFLGGPPVRYAVVGERHVQQQPAAACELFVDIGTSTYTASTILVYVEGIRSDGSLVTITKTLNVTLPTQSLATTETAIIAVTKFYLKATSVPTTPQATILRSVSGVGTELARIGVGQTNARYLTVEWSPIPTGASTFYADVTRHINELVEANDEPFLPPDLHYVLTLGARAKEYEYLDDARKASALAEYRAGQIALKSWILNDGDRIASLRPIRRGFSSLGPMYPAGS